MTTTLTSYLRGLDTATLTGYLAALLSAAGPALAALQATT